MSRTKFVCLDQCYHLKCLPARCTTAPTIVSERERERRTTTQERKTKTSQCTESTGTRRYRNAGYSNLSALLIACVGMCVCLCVERVNEL